MAAELNEPGLEARAKLFRTIAAALIVVTLVVPIALASSGYLSCGGAVNCFTQSLLVAVIGYGITWAVTRADRLPKRRSLGYMLVALLVIVLATENIPKAHGEVDRLSNFLVAASALEQQQAKPVDAAANAFDDFGTQPIFTFEGLATPEGIAAARARIAAYRQLLTTSQATTKTFFDQMDGFYAHADLSPADAKEAVIEWNQVRAPISGIATDLWNARNRSLEANVAVLDWFTSQQPPLRIVNGNFSGLTQAQYADSQRLTGDLTASEQNLNTVMADVNKRQAALRAQAASAP